MVDVQPPVVMPSGKAVPLTFRAIRLILDRNRELGASGSALSSSIVFALETALRGPSLVGGDSYRVALTPEDGKTLTVWCREIAAASSPRDGAVLHVVADIIEAAP